jgi:hypothetical protein
MSSARTPQNNAVSVAENDPGCAGQDDSGAAGLFLCGETFYAVFIKTSFPSDIVTKMG